MRKKKETSEQARREKRELRVRTKDLSALLRIAETTTQSLDTEKILNDTLDESLAFLGFEIGFIRILERETKNTVVRVARGLTSREFLSSVIPIDSPERRPA